MGRPIAPFSEGSLLRRLLPILSAVDSGPMRKSCAKPCAAGSRLNGLLPASVCQRTVCSRGGGLGRAGNTVAGSVVLNLDLLFAHTVADRLGLAFDILAQAVIGARPSPMPSSTAWSTTPTA